MPDEAERVVFPPEIALEIPEGGAGGAPGQTVTLPAERHCEEMKRVIPVGTDPRKSVESGHDWGIPPPARLQS